MNGERNSMSTPGRHKHIESALIRLRKRIRRVQWLRGAAQCLALLLFALLMLVLADQRFAPLPGAARWTMLAGWLALGAASAWLLLVRPLSRPLDTVRLARWLETRHPELDERASTVLELDEGHGTGEASSSLLADLAVEAARDLDAIQPNREVSTRKAKPWFIAVGALFAAWLLLFAVWPERTTRHLVRVLAPASDLGTAAGRIVVAPGDADVMEGNPVEIRAQVKGKSIAAPLEITLVMDDGTEIVETMSPGPDGAVFRLEKAERDFTYRVQAGRETSDLHRITVWPPPRLVDPRVRLEFPAYTNQAPREISLGAPDVQINAIVGTRATLRAGLNTPVKSARMEIDGSERGKTKLDRGADGGRLEIAWPMKSPEAAEARVVLTHPIGGDFDALRFPVNTLPDTAPKIHWLAPTRAELRLRPDDAFQFSWQATDDIGLAGAALEIEASPGGAGTMPLPLPDRIKRLVPATWRGDGEQTVGALLDRWPKARDFRIRIRVRDGRPQKFGGPNSGATEWKHIVIDRAAPSLARQELMAQDAETKKTIEEARRNANEAHRYLVGQRPNVISGKMTEETRSKLARAREQLAKTRDSLRKLSENMQESVHAASTPKMAQAADNLAKALELAEDAPLSEDKDARDQKMTESVKSVQDALKQIEEIRAEIQRRKGQLLDLAKLKELEQQQRELARKAADRAAAPPEQNPNSESAQNPQSRQNRENSTGQNPPPAPAPEWRSEQESTAAKIREAAKQRPKARAALLEEQARQAQDLAKQAAAQASTQRRLAQAAKEQTRQNPENTQPNPADANQNPSNNQDSNPQARQQSRETTRKTLAREQKSLAREAEQSLAEARQQRLAAENALPEAAEAAKQAAKNLEQNNDESAAEQARTAAEALNSATRAQQKKSNPSPNSQPSENSRPAEQNPESLAAAQNLSNLAERQEQLADAIEAFAQGDEAKARAELAELAASQTGKLTAAIESMPLVNPNSGPLSQARQASRSATSKAALAAEQAARTSQNPAQASPAQAQQEAAAHSQASEKLDQTASALSRAAEEFSSQASQLADRSANRDKAPASPQALAKAFSQAAQASNAQSSPQAAAHANLAAQALAKATRDAMRSMQGRRTSQGQQDQQAQNGQNNNQPPADGKAAPSADKAQEGLRSPQADPGVPPELAKLGISTGDWAKIKAALKSNTGADAEIQVPEEYRDLVRQYFEQMAREK